MAKIRKQVDKLELIHLSDKVRSITIHKLQIFVAVSATGSYTAASKLLSLDQAAVSRTVKNLEARLGQPLVVASKKGITLTPFGERFLAIAEGTLESMIKAATDKEDFEQGRRGHLKLGYAISILSDNTVSSIVQTYVNEHEGVDFDMHEITSAHQIELIESNSPEINVGLVRSPPEYIPGVDRLKILTEPLYIAVPKAHRLFEEIKAADTLDENGNPHRMIVDISEFAQDNWILVSEESNPIFHNKIIKACEAARFKPGENHKTHVIESDKQYAIISLVAAGMGVAAVPAAVTTLSSPRIAYAELKNPILTELTCIWHIPGADEPPIPQVVLDFIDVIKDAIQSREGN